MDNGKRGRDVFFIPFFRKGIAMKFKIRLKYAFNCVFLFGMWINNATAMIEEQQEQTLAIQKFLHNYQQPMIAVDNKTAADIRVEVISYWPYLGRRDEIAQMELPNGYFAVYDIKFDETNYPTYDEKHLELLIIGSGAINPYYLVKTSTIESNKKKQLSAFNGHLPKGPGESEEVYVARTNKQKCIIDEYSSVLNTYTFITVIRVLSEAPFYLSYQPGKDKGVVLRITDSFVPSYPRLHATVFDGDSILQRRFQVLYDANYAKLLSGESHIPLIMHTIIDPSDTTYRKNLTETMDICSPSSGWQHYVWMLGADYFEIENVTVNDDLLLLRSVDSANQHSVMELKLLILRSYGGFMCASDVVPLYDLKRFRAFNCMTSLYGVSSLLAATAYHSVIDRALSLLRLGFENVDFRTSDFSSEDAIVLSAILDEQNLNGTIVLPPLFIVDNPASFDPLPRDTMLKRYVPTCDSGTSYDVYDSDGFFTGNGDA